MTQTEPLLFILYVSHNTIPEAELPQEIARILDASRRNNAAAGITGALIYSRDSFAQALEGPEGEVRALYRRLSADPRHADPIILAEREVQQRQFGRWSMAFAGRRDGLDAGALLGGREVEGMLEDGVSADSPA